GGLAWGFEQIAGEREPQVVWSVAFLEQQVRDAVLRYLAVAHFGRGSGAFQERARPAYWGAAVDAALEPHKGTLKSLFRRARDAGEGSRADLRNDLRSELDAILRGAVERVLPDFYPGCERFLRSTDPS
ncbi:MAG: hypothetical protein QNK05_19080, partial [Myxococcota bacterium]|nr:hypothetical protein [Myxococcota bacterium]